MISGIIVFVLFVIKYITTRDVILKNGVDMFSKAVFRYDHAVASFQVRLGVKTEGSMTTAGTKGYVYVPAPWWKTDYFEVRYEDQN